MMTRDELVVFWEKKHKNEYIEFDRVKKKYSNRHDVSAFILLDKLAPGGQDLIMGSNNEKIWLNVNINRMLANATDEQLIDLRRCGVFYDKSNDSLAMFL